MRLSPFVLCSVLFTSACASTPDASSEVCDGPECAAPGEGKADGVGCGGASWLPWCDSPFELARKLPKVGDLRIDQDTFLISSKESITQCDAKQCTEIALPDVADRLVEQTHVRSSRDIWIASKRYTNDVFQRSIVVSHFDGTAWTDEYETERRIDQTSMIASAEDGTIVVGLGDYGVLVRDGGHWSHLRPQAFDANGVTVVPSIRSVSVRSARDIWAGCDLSSIVHYDGTSWTRYQPLPLDKRWPTPGDQYADNSTLEYEITRIFASSSSEVWALATPTSALRGTQSFLLFFDGNEWTEAYARTFTYPQQKLTQLLVDGGKLWLAGLNTIVRYDGRAFKDVNPPGYFDPKGSEGTKPFGLGISPRTQKLWMSADYRGTPYLLREK